MLPDNHAVGDWYQACLDPPPGSLRGQLVNASGQPLAGVRLRLLSGGEEVAARTLRTEVGYWGWTALRVSETDSQGRFEFSCLKPGNYLLASRLTAPLANPPGQLIVGEGALELGVLRLEQP